MRYIFSAYGTAPDYTQRAVLHLRHAPFFSDQTRGARGPGRPRAFPAGALARQALGPLPCCAHV